VNDSAPATIADLPKASRYLFELTATMPFDAAVERVRSKADPKTGNELDALKRYVRGESATKPAGDLVLYAELMKGLPDSARAGQGVRALRESLAEARALAADTRDRLPADVFYSGLLLLVAALLGALWLVYLAPEYAALVALLGAQLPALSEAIVDGPWLIFGPLALLAAALMTIATAGYRLAAAMETLAPLPTAWIKAAAGRRAARAHERWRLTTLASARVHAGVEPADAAREAVAAGQDVELERELRLALELGLAAHELEHQRQRSLLDYRGALELRRTISLRALHIAIAAVVGAIVIAIYLPIFRLGAIV
jgi:hypothetical protein